MDGILREINFAFVYLDDILVASPSPEAHRTHLRQLFSLLSSHGISLNRKKCVFGQSSVKYLGHLVSEAGISPLPARVQDLVEFPPPLTKVGLQRFLGMINYYRRFVPGLAKVLNPLHSTVAAAGRFKDVVMDPNSLAAFSSAKSALASATLLHHPSPFSETALTVDLSLIHI